MSYHEDDELEEEREPRELPEIRLDQPGECVVCGNPGATHACFRCGEPVHMDPTNYQADSPCGGWILDWWHNSAYDPDDGNEFWCKTCLKEEQEELARQAEHELRESQVTASWFSSEEAYEAWCEDH